MQAQTSQQCVVVSFDTYCMNARGKINIYDIPILSFNISLDNPNLANLVSRQKGFTLGARPGYVERQNWNIINIYFSPGIHTVGVKANYNALL